MAVAQSLAITRTSLSLSDLVITNTTDRSDAYCIPEGGLAFPDFDATNTYAPDNDGVSGSALLSYRLALGSLSLVIDVRGASLSALQANRRALENAFYQASYTLTIGVGDETEVYPAFPAWPKWGAINSGDLAAGILTATLAVPVNPLDT